MKQTCLNPDNTVFVILSFEGPDLYSLAGGLGIRVSNIARTLADQGFETHLFFIGDPGEKGIESLNERLYLHRWCQWISKYYPQGVYQGEYNKINDYNESIPAYIVKEIAPSVISNDKTLVVLGEEWHTAETMSRISDQLYSAGLREKTLMFWNANNTFGFNNIDWQRLSYTSCITTVSRYMKSIMRQLGLDPVVIPNGIPSSLLEPVDDTASRVLRRIIKADSILFKVARWDPDKRWECAVDTVSYLKDKGCRTVLLARGGIEPYSEEIMKTARRRGLSVKDACTMGNTFSDYLDAIRQAANADIINIKFHCPQQFLRLLYHSSDAVLANSRHEPFGLVGLETMASGGIAFTGGTGEDYATPFYNSIVLETSDVKEVTESLTYLMEYPIETASIRQNAQNTAKYFTWDRVIRILIRKLEYQACLQGIITPPKIKTETPALIDEKNMKPIIT